MHLFDTPAPGPDENGVLHVTTEGYLRGHNAITATCSCGWWCKARSDGESRVWAERHRKGPMLRAAEQFGARHPGIRVTDGFPSRNAAEKFVAWLDKWEGPGNRKVFEVRDGTRETAFHVTGWVVEHHAI